MAVVMTPPYLQFFDSNGAVLAGGKVFTYTATGTFSTNKATFTTAAGSVEHPNPVILDSAGRPDTGNGSIWLEGTYDFVVKTSADVTIETTLGVTAFTALPAASNAYFESFSGTGSQTAFTTSDDLGTDEKAIYVWVDSGLAESVTNGSFATDSDWTKGTGWSIGSGVATAAGAISVAISQTSAITIIEGQAYSVTYTITRSAGGLIPSVGGNDGVERTASGTYTEIILGGSTEVLAFTGNSFTGTLDNVSITVASTAGLNVQNPSAYTISGTTLTFTTAPASGTNNIFVSAPSLLVGAASSSAADAATSAAAAAASETAAAASATQLTGTSTTSLAIAVASKAFTTQSSKFFDVGTFLLITSDADETNYMHGQVTAYSGTSLTVNVTNIGGSGTFADWTIRVAGTQGAKGDTGSISDLSGVAAGTITTSDKVIFDDVDDSNATKSSTVAALLALGGGAWEIVTTNSPSSATSTAFTSGIDNTGFVYKVEFELDPEADFNAFVVDVSTNAGSSWLTAAGTYNFHGRRYPTNSATPVSVISTVFGATGGFVIDGGTPPGGAAGEQIGGSFVIRNPASSTFEKEISANMTFSDAGGTHIGAYTWGMVGTTTAINGLRFRDNSAAAFSGTFKLYRLKV